MFVKCSLSSLPIYMNWQNPAWAWLQWWWCQWLWSKTGVVLVLQGPLNWTNNCFELEWTFLNMMMMLITVTKIINISNQLQERYQCCGGHGTNGFLQWEDFLNGTYPDSCCTVRSTTSTSSLSCCSARTYPSWPFLADAEVTTFQRQLSSAIQTVAGRHDEPLRRHRCTSESTSADASPSSAEPSKLMWCRCCSPGDSSASWSASLSFSSSSSACSLPTTWGPGSGTQGWRRRQASASWSRWPTRPRPAWPGSRSTQAPSVSGSHRQVDTHQNQCH